MYHFVRTKLFAPVLIVILTTASVLQAGSPRAKVEEFLNVTGFDVALESLRLSARSAPTMLGLDQNDFGDQWTTLTEDVFDTELMHGLAVDILEETLEEDLLDHASAFYASEFGIRLVTAENTSHMDDDDATRSEAGEAIVAGLVRIGSPRVGELRRMNAAVGGIDTAIRALHEVQVRFLMSASAAGVIELQMDEPDLRALLEMQEPELRRSLLASSLTSAAYTYQSFSDQEVTDYANALEHPKMQKVYELMNAVQYEIMANRFEALGAAMADLQPSTDL